MLDAEDLFYASPQAPDVRESPLVDCLGARCDALAKQLHPETHERIMRDLPDAVTVLFSPDLYGASAAESSPSLRHTAQKGATAISVQVMSMGGAPDTLKTEAIALTNRALGSL